MFLVPTVLDRSSIHGMGVFAAERIPADTRVWEFTEGVDWHIEPEEMERFPEPFQSRLREWSYREESGIYVLCGDNAKFMNHAESPSCDDSGAFTRTIHDIEAGEELTCDYRVFDADAANRELDYVSDSAEVAGAC